MTANELRTKIEALMDRAESGDDWAEICRLEAEMIREAAAEIEKLEKERFKYETALMLIGEGYPGAVGLAKTAVTKVENV